jgi:hypothetical protein
MKTIMKLEDLTTIDQLTDFLSGTQAWPFRSSATRTLATAGLKRLKYLFDIQDRTE